MTWHGLNGLVSSSSILILGPFIHPAASPSEEQRTSLKSALMLSNVSSPSPRNCMSSATRTPTETRLTGEERAGSSRSVSSGNCIDTPKASRSRRQTRGGPKRPEETTAEISALLPFPSEATSLTVPSFESGCPVAERRRVRDGRSGVFSGTRYLGNTVRAAPESATTRILSETCPKSQTIRALGVYGLTMTVETESIGERDPERVC